MATPNNSSSREDTIEVRIQTERVIAYFEQGNLPTIMSVMISGIICFVLWNETDHYRLLGWFSIIVLGALWRRNNMLAFQKQSSDSPDDNIRWENKYYSSVLFTSLGWGLGGIWIMPVFSEVHQLFVFFMLVGMASTGTLGFSTSAPLVRIVTISILLPISVWFAFQESSIYWAMSFSTLAYLGVVIRYTRNLEISLRRTIQLSVDLEIASKKVQFLANTDDLTQLNNRRQFTNLAEIAIESASRYENPLSLAVIDIDRFKSINDNFGHAAGDEILRTLANTIKQTARASDIIGRLGGDEFVILLPETSINDAINQIERMQKSIREFALKADDQDVKFTCSYGLVEQIQPHHSLTKLISLADKALYESKDKGGNIITKYIKQ